ncbi:SWIM zinc finger family protein [Flavobacterium sp. PL002]|uniref:SWIM zinc finger family protein n=1 Tax=Flavobacterium sp. PL002 TaxID=1897058 RepID=UPI0017889F97|nr:SWIM zinc finger family protein [Flavobacterium sp. PL002]MBE0390333.1 hypothetical protein [Flavobacterium sp. PL002]
MEITLKKIEELAPNAAAAKNGQELVKKSKFSNLKINADNNLIWGECAGSGKNPYYCSADYMEATSPVFRCNCPSRQFPCKHAIGLLYAFAQGNAFDTAEIPEDILSKRNKQEQKLEKKTQEKERVKDKTVKAKKINTAAFIKKIDAQLLGIDTAKKILNNMVQTGLSAIDAKERNALVSQVKELGNYYIGGIQTSFNNLILELKNVQNEEYSTVINEINFITALLKKSTDYLTYRKENPEAAPEISSAIEEQIGTIWKLAELMQYGLWEENAALLQLSFNSFDHQARSEFIDEGTWINLKTGKLYKTKNYRPYKASKYIKEDNTNFDVLELKELFIYPGSQNPRVRWESDAVKERTVSKRDLETIHSFASTDYAETIKAVKNAIKNPLMDKNPVVLIALQYCYLNGEKLVVVDNNEYKITLSANESLKSFLPENSKGLSLLAMMGHNVETGLLSAEPMALVTTDKIIRLFF